MLMRKNRSLLLLLAAILCMIPAGTFFAGAVQSAGSYSNPVLVEIFPMNSLNANTDSPHRPQEMMGIGDPSVIFYKNRYYLYATGDNKSYDVYTSPDLVIWSKGPKIFKSDESGVWAPDVFYDARGGKFYLYYTVDMRIGVAVADGPEGTFRDAGTLVKHAIDAHLFLDDDGKYYLYYAGYPGFSIFVQPMDSPVRKNGRPVQLLRPTEAWEKKGLPVTEAPWMLKQEGTYYLLYSGSGANTADYAIGYATAKSPVGPFIRYDGNPLVQRGPGVFGPGHCSVTKDRAGNLWMVYHQKTDAAKGWTRIICIDPLWFDEKGVLHGRATRGTPEPAPQTGP